MGNYFELSFICIFIICLILISAHDLKFYIIPDKYLMVLLMMGIFFVILYCQSILDSLLGFLLSLCLMWIVYFVSRGGMGFGDVKLSAVLGLWLGLDKSMMMLILAFIIGALVGIAAIITGFKTREDYLPFGPFLCLSSLIVWFYYNEILTIYKQILKF